MKTKQYRIHQARRRNSLQIVRKNKWLSTAIFLSDLKGNIRVVHSCISTLRLHRNVCISLDHSPDCQERSCTLLHCMVPVKLVRLAVKSPCCSFLNPLWFADFWTSVTHEGHENQRLPHLRWPRKPPLSSLTFPQHCCTAGLSTKRREALYGMGPSPDPQPAPCLTVGRLAAENSLHCSPLPSAADLDKGSFN